MFLHEFSNVLVKFSYLNLRNKNAKKKKKQKCNNNFLDKYFDEYYDLGKEKEEELGSEFMPIKLKTKVMFMINCMIKHQLKIMKIMMILMNLLIFQICHH